MVKLIKYLSITAIVIFAAVQLIRPTFSNPPIIPGQPIEESTEIPAEVQMLFSRSCNDCHSNKTEYPWYTNITPANWFMAGHLEEGRREVNFSEWASYSNDKKLRKLEEICEMVSEGLMPLPSYLLLHRDAQLTSEQRNLICAWSQDEVKRLSSQ